jgi:hypothetical protein
MTLAHPITGQVLPDDDLDALQAALADANAAFAAARAIRLHIAETAEWSGPPPARMSDRQLAAYRCPRCGQRYKA